MVPHYVIAVSEGRFRVLERFARPGQLRPTLREVVNHDFMPVGGGVGGRELDRADRFPVGVLRAAQAIDEHPPLPDDEQRRTVDWLADQIENFILGKPGQAWAFAAADNLHDAVLERLRPSVRGSLVESIRKNLALTPPAELAVHLRVRA
jgi:hypothetical protein